MLSKLENNKLDEFRKRDPFRVPDGYFEGFTEDLMSRLPQKTAAEPKIIPLYDRLKPWFYMAAIFAGAIILFNVFYKTDDTIQMNDKNKPGIMASSEGVFEGEDEDADFLEFIEEYIYSSNVLAVSYINDDFWNN